MRSRENNAVKPADEDESHGLKEGMKKIPAFLQRKDEENTGIS